MTSTKASRHNVNSYHQSHYKLPANISRKKALLYLKFYIGRKQIGIFLNIIRERLDDNFLLFHGFKLLHQYVIKGLRQKQKTVQYGALPIIKKVLKMHCIDTSSNEKNNELRRILCALITSMGKEYGKDMIAHGIFEDLVEILKIFIEYYSQFNKKLCGTKQVENFYINIIRSISSILNIHGNHHVNDNNNNIHTQNLNEAKPLHVMLDFIKQQKEVDVNSKLTEEILLKYLKIGSELFQKHVRCVESTYVCVRCLCVYI